MLRCSKPIKTRYYQQAIQYKGCVCSSLTNVWCPSNKWLGKSHKTGAKSSAEICFRAVPKLLNSGIWRRQKINKNNSTCSLRLSTRKLKMDLQQGFKNAEAQLRRATKNLGVCERDSQFRFCAFLPIRSLISFPLLCFGLSEMTC